MIEKFKKLFREMFLYGIFGLFSAGMDTLSFWLFSKIGMPLLGANFIGVNIGITISFFLNSFINFKRTDSLGKRAIKFYGVGYVGLLLSTLIMWVGVEKMYLQSMYVKVFSVILVAAVQYLANKFFTFKK